MRRHLSLIHIYYACLFTEDGVCGLAFCDVSTGAFHVTQTSGEDWAESACNELGSFLPAEALLGGEATESEPVNAVPVSYTHLDVYKRQDNFPLHFS